MAIDDFYGGYYPYKGGDNDSNEAYFGEDLSLHVDDYISLSETIANEPIFINWNRQQSNKNIEDNGFSFYLARKIFNDPYSYLISENKANIWIGTVPNDKEVMAVEFEPSISANTILSAKFLDKNDKIALEYWNNRKAQEGKRTFADDEKSIKLLECLSDMRAIRLLELKGEKVYKTKFDPSKPIKTEEDFERGFDYIEDQIISIIDSIKEYFNSYYLDGMIHVQEAKENVLKKYKEVTQRIKRCYDNINDMISKLRLYMNTNKDTGIRNIDPSKERANRAINNITFEINEYNSITATKPDISLYIDTLKNSINNYNKVIDEINAYNNDVAQRIPEKRSHVVHIEHIHGLED